MASLISKLMNKLITERDWPAMEVAHLILDLPLSECSHVFQAVDCRDPRQVKVAMVAAEGKGVHDVKKIYQNYCGYDCYGTVLGEAEDDEFVEVPDLPKDDITAAEWQLMAGELPNRGIETDDIGLLSNRPIHLSYNWQPHVGKYAGLYNQRSIFGRR
ncbi:hypothetical protein B0H63DRAFT_456109 [Podospora didyma]|uniref:Uncharacterized protein n=1 Tax=Podospora didyma TaxID=330526 RepID=A0AAE0N0I9_9PEZI|nr:hypothetical protein B0H63DRAFT_456109 [Podospora didyma]